MSFTSEEIGLLKAIAKERAELSLPDKIYTYKNQTARVKRKLTAGEEKDWHKRIDEL